MEPTWGFYGQRCPYCNPLHTGRTPHLLDLVCCSDSLHLGQGGIAQLQSCALICLFMDKRDSIMHHAILTQ